MDKLMGWRLTYCLTRLSTKLHMDRQWGDTTRYSSHSPLKKWCNGQFLFVVVTFLGEYSKLIRIRSNFPRERHFDVQISTLTFFAMEILRGPFCKRKYLRASICTT